MEAINGLYALPVHTYRYKDGYISEEDERYGKKIPGFIAEEVEEVLPIAVDHVDGQAEMWNSNILVPCLLKLIQDLNERLTVLEKGKDKIKNNSKSETEITSQPAEKEVANEEWNS